MGVIGMNLSFDDQIIGMQLHTQGDYLLLVSEFGMGKRTSIDEFTTQKRGGKGVKCYKITEKTGNVVGVKAVNENNEIMIITTEGIIIRLMVNDISSLGRITSGVRLMNFDSSNITVASIAKVRESNDNVSEEEVLKHLEEELEKEDNDAQNLEEEMVEGMSEDLDNSLEEDIDELINRAEQDSNSDNLE